MKTSVVQLRLEPKLSEMIDDAVNETGLTKSELMRQALRKGVPQVVRSFSDRPRRSLLDALKALKGLEVPERHHSNKFRL